MKYTSKTGRSIGFIFVLSIAVLMMVGFSTKFAKADPCILPDFDPAEFDTSTDITNPFFTLPQGKAFCYQSDSEDGERNEVTVTNCKPLDIGGVSTIIVRDVVKDEDGNRLEDTFDFYAQDNAGNVWYLGEATKECLVDDTEGTWNANDASPCPDSDNCPTAGEDDYCSCGGDPGTIMLADPMLGNCYQQEFLPDHAEDIAKVMSLNATVSVPYELGSCDQECLKTKEWTPLANGDIEYKFYTKNLLAPDIGNNVLTEELKGGKTVRVELVDLQDVKKDGYCPNSFGKAFDALCVKDVPTTNCEFN